MLATWHFHIEISSKCTLRCPRCARQEVPNGLINTELDLSFFKRNFTPQFLIDNVEKITFCGDDGDPIYVRDLISVIQYIKNIKPIEIVIIINGSYKNTTWWKSLAQSLSHNDSIHFSVDGYDNVSNNMYRVNSNFDSIISGIKTVRANSTCIITWAAIAFKFNENHLLAMQEQARLLGVDIFQITKSTKFGCVYPSYGDQDPLQPNTNLISDIHRFQREFIRLTDRKENPINKINLKLYEKAQNNKNIIPLCEIGNKGLYIDAKGRLFPCCWVANRYNHNNEWQVLAEKFNLHLRNLTDVINDPFWENEFQSFKWQECQTKCNRQVVTKEYATSW